MSAGSFSSSTWGRDVYKRQVGEMLSRRETMPGCGLYTLSLPDFILHLCAHLYKEATVMAWVEMGRDQSLYKYADLYLLTELFLRCV